MNVLNIRANHTSKQHSPWYQVNITCVQSTHIVNTCTLHLFSIIYISIGSCHANKSMH